MDVVSRMWVWVESMGVASWCGCKEVYMYLDLLILLIPLFLFAVFGSNIILLFTP